MPLATIDASNSGYVRGQGAVYATIHDQANADFVYNDVLARVGQTYFNSTFFVDRVGLVFDTSLLAGATVVKLSLCVLVDGSTDNEFDIVVVNGSDLADPFIAADYGDLLDDTTSLGLVNTTDLPAAESRTEINLDTSGINFGGTTKLALRSSRDISSSTPKLNGADYWEYVNFYGVNTAGKKPQLVIGAQGMGNIAVVETGFHYIDAYGTERYIKGTIVT